MDRYVKAAALTCGEFCITNRWIRGSISNYRMVFNAYRRLKALSQLVLSSKKKSFSKFFENWALSRYTWPRAVFISSLQYSYFSAKEAMSLKIPSIAIVDTNSWTQSTSIPIPGNDESLGCIIYYNDLISNFILSRKFNMVSIWYFNIRSISRVVKFTDWLFKTYSVENSSLLRNVVLYKSNSLNNFVKSFNIFLSGNVNKLYLSDKLNIFNSTRNFLSFSQAFSTFVLSKNRILMSMNFHFVKKFWSLNKFFKKNFLTENNFKLRFLQRDFFNKKFLTRKYLKKGLQSSVSTNDFFLGIANFYFLNKYLEKWSMPSLNILKLKYWRIIATILTDKYNKTLLWQKRKSGALKSSFSLSKDLKTVTLKRSNNLILLSKLNLVIN